MGPKAHMSSLSHYPKLSFLAFMLHGDLVFGTIDKYTMSTTSLVGSLHNGGGFSV